MEPWFDPKTAGLFSAIFIGFIGGAVTLMESCCRSCIGKGWKKFALPIFTVALAVCVAMIVTGIVAGACKQPLYVMFSFAVPGILGTIFFSCLFPIVQKRFKEDEFRQMQAKDL